MFKVTSFQVGMIGMIACSILITIALNISDLEPVDCSQNQGPNIDTPIEGTLLQYCNLLQNFLIVNLLQLLPMELESLQLFQLWPL